jgi:hypothetical protein
MIVTKLERTRQKRTRKPLASATNAATSSASPSFLSPNGQQKNTVLPNYVTGKLIGVDSLGHPLVIYPQSQGKHVKAKTFVALQRCDFGRDIGLVFENGDLASPAIIGFPISHVVAPERIEGAHSAPRPIRLDSPEIIFKADRDMVFECGKSSITLTKDGRIEIKGLNIVSKASQTNKIKGGAVLLN